MMFVLKNYKFFKDASELLNFDDYDILIELIGGEEGVSKKLVFDALKKGKKVVTANKALVSKHWHKIKQLTKNDLSQIKFEAVVAGGIPIIKILNDFLIFQIKLNIFDIKNGTSNFILTNMLSSKEKFDKILAKAQSLGYAESDPSFDIDGIDTAHKLSILCSLSYNVNCNLNNIYIEGIRNIDLTDILYAEELGYSVKLLGITKIKNRKLINFVYPCLIDKDQLIAKVDGVYNGIVVESDFCKKSFFQGEGAGSFPTATSVMSDIIDLSLNKSKKILFKKKELPYFQISERFGSYYLRFSTVDEPGVISGISNEFKSNNISMKSMLQKENF